MSILAEARAASPPAAPARDRSVTRVLAGVEARRLVRDPLFVAGGALAVAMFSSSHAFGEGGYWLVTGPGHLALALGTLLAVDLAALRSHRSGTDELLESAPLPARARTAAHVDSLAAAAVVALAWLAVGVAYTAATGADAGESAPGPLAYLAGPISVAAAGALGLALARWLPGGLPALLAVPALFVLAGRLPERASWAVLLAATGLTVALAAFALLRHGWRVRTALACTAGAAAALAGVLVEAL